MNERPKHTPGPFDIRPVMGEDEVEIYSTVTGQSLASVHAPSWKRSEAPDHETALHNAVLFTAAPQMREVLQELLGNSKEQIRPTTAEGIRSLLSNIDAGPSETFVRERDKQQREREEVLQAQVDEMARQSDTPEQEREESDGEEQGPAFGF